MSKFNFLFYQVRFTMCILYVAQGLTPSSTPSFSLSLSVSLSLSLSVSLSLSLSLSHSKTLCMYKYCNSSQSPNSHSIYYHILLFTTNSHSLAPLSLSLSLPLILINSHFNHPSSISPCNTPVYRTHTYIHILCRPHKYRQYWPSLSQTINIINTTSDSSSMHQTTNRTGQCFHSMACIVLLISTSLNQANTNIIFCALGLTQTHKQTPTNCHQFGRMPGMVSIMK